MMSFVIGAYRSGLGSSVGLCYKGSGTVAEMCFAGRKGFSFSVGFQEL